MDHPWMGGLFADPEVAALLSAEAQLRHMVAVEAAFARAMGSAAAAKAISNVALDVEALRKGTARDGLPVPDLVRQLKAGVPERLRGVVHLGMTSQDVMDTALVLSLRAVLAVFEQRISALEADLQGLITMHGATPLMGRTRMQAAIEMTVADRVTLWLLPLARHRARLADLRPRALLLQLGGPVGTCDGLPAGVAQAMARDLGLARPEHAWHVQRDGIAELAGWVSLVSGTLGKMGQDLALMAQMGEVQLTGGGTSSAMPHKQNPILAEHLVSLARFNAVQVSGMHQALVHEQERSGAAWALEWMILPQMLLATGRGLSAAQGLVMNIATIGTVSEP